MLSWRPWSSGLARRSTMASLATSNKRCGSTSQSTSLSALFPSSVIWPMLCFGATPRMPCYLKGSSYNERSRTGRRSVTINKCLQRPNSEPLQDMSLLCQKLREFVRRQEVMVVGSVFSGRREPPTLKGVKAFRLSNLPGGMMSWCKVDNPSIGSSERHSSGRAWHNDDALISVARRSALLFSLCACCDREALGDSRRYRYPICS